MGLCARVWILGERYINIQYRAKKIYLGRRVGGVRYGCEGLGRRYEATI